MIAEFSAFLNSLGSKVSSWIAELGPGDWPTLGATVLAFLAVTATVWTLGRQIKQDRQRDLVQKRQQASRVVAWVSTEELRHARGGSSFGSGAKMSTLRLSNASGIPVFQVKVFLVSEQGAEKLAWERDVLPPMDAPDALDITKPVAEQSVHSVRLTLTDANGVRWQRSSKDHLLREIKK